MVMAVTVHIPTALRAYTDRRESVETEGGSVGEVLQQLTAAHPPLRPHLFTPDGRLRSFVNIYLNDEDIRYTGRESTPVKPGDSLSIVPAVAGGR